MMDPMTDAPQAHDKRTHHDDSLHDPMVDQVIVAGQIGRSPRAMDGVAARCVFGFPAATRQATHDEGGRPFPTAVYLTCPHLVRNIDRLEAAGGVGRYEQLLTIDPELRAATDAAHARHRALDDRNANIAATSDTNHLKCLHAHAAWALAFGEHPLGQQVLEEAAPRWCDDARCVRHAPDPA
jgi:hypothetical protein